MRAAVFFILASMVRHGLAMLRDEIRTKNAQDEAGNDTVRFPEQWYEHQELDHFDPRNNRTFRQRYFANFEHYKPGGPVILYIGGEGPLHGKSAVGGHVSNALFAKEMAGATVALEHRFYGKSQPFSSLATEHLVFLTSRQALHDLAQFQRWLMSTRSLNTSQFLCMGGSYPGNLAAWYRLEFPEMTSGCWASSAPVQAQEVWPGFGQKVWQAVATDWRGAIQNEVAVKLYAGYQQISGLIQDSTVEAFEVLREKFNICPGTLVSQQDRDNLESAITQAPGGIMQYNNTHEPHLKVVRELVMNASTPLDAALGVSAFLNLTRGGGTGNCTDYSIGSMYRDLLNVTLPADGTGNAGRTWTWQTCNEFGYFQTGTSTFDKPTMYTQGSSSRALWQQVCEDIFGVSAASISSRIASTNLYYGGTDPHGITNVFFSNGELDAWSLLGITEYPANDREVYAEVAPLGSHCVGLYSPMEGEVPGATSIRQRALGLFKAWTVQQSGSDVHV